MKQEDDYSNAWPNAEILAWEESHDFPKTTLFKRDYQMETKNDKGALYRFLYIESS